MNGSYFHVLDTVTITDPASPWQGRHGVVEWVRPQSLRVSVWAGTWPPAQIEIPKAGVQHRAAFRHVRPAA